jgi:hypothetical protein
MNDIDLSTAVRDSVADIHAATPVGAIISRGRGVRARRQIPVAAGARTVAAGTALAVTTLVTAGHGAGFPPHPSGSTATHGTTLQHPPTGSLLRGLDGPLTLGLVCASAQCTG